MSRLITLVPAFNIVGASTVDARSPRRMLMSSSCADQMFGDSTNARGVHRLLNQHLGMSMG